MKSDNDLVSVDAFCGLITANIIIRPPLISAIHNLPQGTIKESFYSQLYNSTWNGLSWADFSSAGFILVIGLVVRFSLNQYKEIPTLRPQFYTKVTRHTLILFLLGLIHNGALTDVWPNIRLCGVLQRIAICYLFVSIIYLHTNIKGRCWCIIILLLEYWGMLSLIPFPGGEAGDLEFDRNLAAWFDSQFVPGRLYYNRWDAEGILPTLPTVASALIGVLWGDLLLSDKQNMQKVIWLILGGIAAINLGILWDTVFPINKPLWTSSYVMVTAGIGAILLGSCFLTIAAFEQKKLLFPFVIIGQNLLIAFLMVCFIPGDQVVHLLTGGYISIFLGNAAPYVSSFTEIILMWFFLLLLYRHNIAIRI